jgi:hypothetical protein
MLPKIGFLVFVLKMSDWIFDLAALPPATTYEYQIDRELSRPKRQPGLNAK